LKVTEIVQLTPALREVPQVLVWEKSPTVPMLEMASGAPPLLVSVTVCALLLVPTISAGKGSEVVDKLTTGAAGSAVTDSATSGAALKFELPAWSNITVQVPVPLVMVNMAPVFVQTPPEEKLTVRPELAVAATVKLLL
jgi:hypothetical protein